jgi:cyanate permease
LALLPLLAVLLWLPQLAERKSRRAATSTTSSRRLEPLRFLRAATLRFFALRAALAVAIGTVVVVVLVG